MGGVTSIQPDSVLLIVFVTAEVGFCGSRALGGLGGGERWGVKEGAGRINNSIAYLRDQP